MSHNLLYATKFEESSGADFCIRFGNPVGIAEQLFYVYF
jgi:hypothetical protein